jgi:hypothetical protein
VRNKIAVCGIFIFILCIVFVDIGQCQSSRRISKRNKNKKILYRYTKVPPVINGRLNRNIWKRANVIYFQHDSLHSKDPRHTSNKVVVRTLWDDNNLYIAYGVKDNNLQATHRIQDGQGLASDDIVEFLIGPRDSKDPCWGPNDIIYHINLLGQKKDSRGSAGCKDNPAWNGRARYAIQLYGTLNDTTDIDRGYSVEVAIPWSEIHRSPHAGLHIGIDFAGGDNGVSFDWAGAWPFRSPNVFGTLILKNNKTNEKT